MSDGLDRPARRHAGQPRRRRAPKRRLAGRRREVAAGACAGHAAAVRPRDDRRRRLQPADGFMTKADYKSVVEDMHLAGGAALVAARDASALEGGRASASRASRSR